MRSSRSPAADQTSSPQEMRHEGLAKVITVEAKLFYREPGTWIVAVLLPTIILVAIGLLFAPHKPEPSLGGRRFIDLFVPSMVVMTLATLGLNTIPARLVKYRERGVLRRLSTTPVAPTALLVAQLLINVVVAVAALVLLIMVGATAFQVPVPQDPSLSWRRSCSGCRRCSRWGC